MGTVTNRDGRQPAGVDVVGEVLEVAASVHAERFGNQFRVESDAEIDEPGRASV